MSHRVNERMYHLLRNYNVMVEVNIRMGGSRQLCNHTHNPVLNVSQSLNRIHPSCEAILAATSLIRPRSQLLLSKILLSLSLRNEHCGWGQLVISPLWVEKLSFGLVQTEGHTRYIDNASLGSPFPSSPCFPN